MAFGDSTESVFEKLLATDFCSDDLAKINQAGADVGKVRLIECKLWVDFCQATGPIPVADACIKAARGVYLSNVAKFSVNENFLSLMKLSQFCATKAGAASGIAAHLGDELITECVFKAACEEVGGNANTSKATTMVPICR